MGKGGQGKRIQGKGAKGKQRSQGKRIQGSRPKEPGQRGQGKRIQGKGPRPKLGEPRRKNQWPGKRTQCLIMVAMRSPWQLTEAWSSRVPSRSARSSQDSALPSTDSLRLFPPLQIAIQVHRSEIKQPPRSLLLWSSISVWLFLPASMMSDQRFA